MSNEQALLDCSFGWGKTCHLYTDSLEIAGKTYNLKELTAVRPTYRTILGVPSARIELYFGLQRLVLRGIGDQETARLLVTHLQPYCADSPDVVRVRQRAGRARSVAREQARTWERSTKLPAFPGSRARTARSPEWASLAEEASVSLLSDDFAPDPLAAGDNPGVQDIRAASSESACDPLLAVRADGWPLAHVRPLHTPRFQPPLRSVHLVPSDQKIRDTCSLPVPSVRSSVLPVIYVPVRLQPGECAHYSIGASLCSDRISGSDRAPYPPLDHGLLILTNRRIFYIGKRSQLILAYTHLWYVSLLHNAIALHIEQQFRRIIVELEHPQEWASRIEQLSFIARRTRPRSDLPTLLMAALPGLSSSSQDAATLKRPVLKVPGPRSQEQSVVPAPGPCPSPGPLAAGDAKDPAISSVGEPPWNCAELSTRDIPLAQAPEGATSLVPSGGSVAERESALPGPMVYADTRTQEQSQTGDLADAVTQEFGAVRDLEDIATRELRSLTTGKKATEQCCDEEVPTCILDGPTSSDWNKVDGADVDTLPLSGKTTDELEDQEEQTIPLRNEHAARAGGRVPCARAAAELPDIKITPRCLSQARPMRRPSSEQEYR